MKNWISSNLNSIGFGKEWCGRMLRKIELGQKSTKPLNFKTSRSHSSILGFKWKLRDTRLFFTLFPRNQRRTKKHAQPAALGVGTTSWKTWTMGKCAFQVVNDATYDNQVKMAKSVHKLTHLQRTISCIIEELLGKFQVPH